MIFGYEKRGIATKVFQDALYSFPDIWDGCNDRCVFSRFRLKQF